MVFPITKEVVNRISSVINWHREALKNNNKAILQVPIKDNWKSWDDNRLWCSFFLVSHLQEVQKMLVNI